jgi:alpha-glucosidase
VAAMLVLTLRGMAYIYNGDEIGMTNTEIPPGKVKDPFEINTPGIGLGRDPERTPIQWNDQLNAGFTDSNEPWLPVNPNYKTVNISKQHKSPKSILSLYKKLINLRKSHQALQYGSQQILNFNNDLVLAFLRIFEGVMILVILNYGSDKQTIYTPFSQGEILIDTRLNKLGQKIRLTSIELEPNEGLVIELKSS